MEEQKTQDEPKRLQPIAIGATGEEKENAENIGRDIIISDLAGNETNTVFTIVGTMSDRYKKMQKVQRERWAKNRKRPTGDDLEKESLELHACVVIGWKGQDGGPGVVDPKNGNAAVPCTLQNVMRILKENPDIREQVVAESNDHTAFFQTSSRS
jgi:hypothetical protein